MNEIDSSKTQFWVKRWEAGKLPWDLGGIPPDLATFLTRIQGSKLKVLIPGCGTGYEIRAFHEAGHDVTAIEFSAPAVSHAHEVLGTLADRIVLGNCFKHDFSGHPFQLIYERGFLCSLPVHRWPDYVTRMASLLVPGGHLVGLFLYGEEPEPPPFPLTDATARDLLAGSFRLLHTTHADTHSVPVYQGMERWQEWERIDSPPS